MVKRTAALVTWIACTGAALAAFLTLPRGWNLLMGAAAATFAAISLAMGWPTGKDHDNAASN